MPIPDLRLARDYNRSVAPPIRWLHISLAAISLASGPLRRWIGGPSRRTWLPYVLVAALLVWLLVPYDDVLLRAVASLNVGGDLRRELEAAQQYGQTLSSLLVALVIWLQDPARRRRLADWAVAFAVTGILATSLKILLGRPRPTLDEPHMFIGPLGAYPLGLEVGFRSSWHFWDVHTTKLWSMPSSHTAYIAVMAVFIATTYPRLKYLVFPMIAVVGFGRALTGAHYITDIIAGAALGLAVAHTVIVFSWGQRLLDRLARRLFPNRRGARAEPSPSVAAARPRTSSAPGTAPARHAADPAEPARVTSRG
jgi:membrane-associated phospholipid phosphatase